MGRALTRVVCKYPSIHFYFLYMLADKKYSKHLET